MKIAEFLPAAPDRLWRLARQMGLRHAICKCAPELTGLNPPWDIDALATIQRRFTEAGFTLTGLEGDQFDMSRIKLGLPGADEDLALYERLLRNMGELGIPLLCLNFMAQLGWHRSTSDAPGRGGALVTRFDLAELPTEPTAAGEVTAERMWVNFETFLRRVVPVAEAAGVRLGLHPDDPPLPRLRGIARVLWRPECFQRAFDAAPSPALGVTFCQANFSLMPGDPMAWCRRFAEQGKLFFVHFRDVRGTAERFEETFHDEGPADMPAWIKLYGDLGFDGPLRVDHVPTMAGEENDRPGYATSGRLFAVGYLKGILQTLRIPYE